MEETWAEELERGATAKQELLRIAGPTLSVAQVARLLGVRSATVRALIRRKGILAVRTEGQQWAIPARQFKPAEHRVISGLPEVLKAFGDLDGWTVLSILLAPNPVSGKGVALDHLEDPVVIQAMVELARTCGDHGAA